MANDDEKTKKSRSGISSTKEGGYAAQKRYREAHPERVREQRRKQKERMRAVVYERKLRIPMANKPILDDLLRSTGLSITELCLGAVEEKYGVMLQKTVDKIDGD